MNLREASQVVPKAHFKFGSCPHVLLDYGIVSSSLVLQKLINQLGFVCSEASVRQVISSCGVVPHAS